MNGSHRAADMEMFGFSRRLNDEVASEDVGPGSFGLHVQAPWHIANRGRIVVGSADIRNPRDGLAGDFNPNQLGTTSREEKLERLFEHQALLVAGARIDSLGGLRMALSRGYTLRVFPDASDGKDESEYWRLLERFGWHVVSSNRGVSVLY